MIDFYSPYLLVLIPIIIILWYLLFREKIGYVNPNTLLKKYYKTPYKILLLWIVRGVIVGLSISILAGPYTAQLQKVPKSNTSHILLMIDISRSMLINDIQPDRITGAKDTIHTFLTKRKGEYIGTMIFAGKPFLSIPFSDDYSGIQSAIHNITPYTIRQEFPGLSGTAIGDALLLGIQTFSGITTENKNILLFTDGRANIGIDPRKIISDLQREDIHVYTIGIGTLSGGIIPGNGISESTGSTTLDEGLLTEIATKTGGRYFHVSASESLNTSLDTINTIISKIPQEEIIEKRIDYRLNLFIILCFSVLLEHLLRRYIFKYYDLL